MPRESKFITQRQPLSSSTHELNQTQKMLENVKKKKKAEEEGRAFCLKKKGEKK
jgi:hypothetical protein